MKGWDLANLFRQAHEMKGKIEQVQKELEQETVTASAGGGMVTVKVNGKLQVVDIQFEPEVVDPKDTSMLRDLMLAAIAEGQRRAAEMAQEKMKDVAGGINLNLPGLG
jgi:DNA-binding YbaB/EbfC family protein